MRKMKINPIVCQYIIGKKCSMDVFIDIFIYI